MLEILLVYGLCKALGNMLRAKGRNPIWMQVMLVACWILGEFTGAIVAGVWHAMQNGPDAPVGIGVYFIAILGAALGTGFTFFIAYLLPNENHASHPVSPPSNPLNDRLQRPVDPNNPYAPS